MKIRNVALFYFKYLFIILDCKLEYGIDIRLWSALKKPN